jgi:hypothetical protein
MPLKIFNLPNGMNPILCFIYAILSKWYFIIAIASTMVVYWVLKGLYDAGVLQAVEAVIVHGLYDVKAVAQHCTPKIANLQHFWECIQNTDAYVEHPDEGSLQKIIDRIKSMGQQNNPYSPNPDDVHQPSL